MSEEAQPIKKRRVKVTVLGEDGSWQEDEESVECSDDGDGAKITPVGAERFVSVPQEQAAEVKDSDESESDEEVAAWAWVNKAPAASGAADSNAQGAAATENVAFAARTATAEMLAVRAARAGQLPPLQPGLLAGSQAALQPGLALQLGPAPQLAGAAPAATYSGPFAAAQQVEAPVAAKSGSPALAGQLQATRVDLVAQNASVLAHAQAQAQALAAQQALQAQAAQPPAAQQAFLVLHGMFKAEQVNMATQPAFFDEIHMDVVQECSRFGSVMSVWVDRASDRGDVWVQFLDAQSASNCRTALDGRWFAGIQVSAEFSSEVALAQRMAATTPASNQGSATARVGTWT